MFSYLISNLSSQHFTAYPQYDFDNDPSLHHNGDTRRADGDMFLLLLSIDRG
jgi:hypothetical protein